MQEAPARLPQLQHPREAVPPSTSSPSLVQGPGGPVPGGRAAPGVQAEAIKGGNPAPALVSVKHLARSPPAGPGQETRGEVGAGGSRSPEREERSWRRGRGGGGAGTRREVARRGVGARGGERRTSAQGQDAGRGGSARGRSRSPRPAVGAPSRRSSAIKPAAGMTAAPPEASSARDPRLGGVFAPARDAAAACAPGPRRRPALGQRRATLVLRDSSQGLQL